MTSQRIMIVEDERIVALNLQQRLIKLGYEVTARAASGHEALAKARETHPDLVLMDIHIEGPMDGVDTAARLRDEQQLRVVYLTAYSEETTLERARKTQPYGYLLKPFSERELHATLQMALARRAADLALVESEERTRLALESASMGSWEFAPGRSELRTYGLAAELLGGEASGGVLSLEEFIACIHPDDRSSVREAVERESLGDKPCSVEFRQIRPDGGLRWVRVVARVFAGNGGGAPQRLIGVAQDVTHRHESDARLKQAATVFDQTREGIFILDGERRLISANPALTEMTGIRGDADAGRELPFLTSQVLPAEALSTIWNAVAANGGWQGEIRVTRADGGLFPGRLSLTAVRGAVGDGVHHVGILSDFTELRTAQDALRRLAQFDSLTGLPNRILVKDRLEQALKRSLRHNQKLAVLFLDLDHFKRINDTRGHAVGDLVLREAAQRIQASLRSEDTAARLGGDEFLILLENVGESSQVISVAEKLREELAQPITASGQIFHIGSSTGIAQFPDDGLDADRLIQAADTAMYEAKAAGRNAYAFYNPGMTVKVARYLARDQRLRRALAQRELCLHYQPQIDIRDGRCVGVEALLRWRHPEHGMLNASEIVPGAEDSGLIIEIGRWALREACVQARQWTQAGVGPMRMAVNVSALQMSSGHLPTDIQTVLQDTGLDPRLLEIEVTESALQTESIAVASLNRVRKLGVGISIDDFGTGYSCLSSLRSLPLDRLKIDQSFVRDLPADGHSVALAETILAIAERMNLDVIAEGVETTAQLDFMRNRGCHSVQGWYYSPAISGDQIPGVMDRWRRAA